MNPLKEYNMTGKWIEIFRTGDYGDKGSYKEADIDQIIANFNETDKVPIVVGHPSTDSPSKKRTGISFNA